MAIIEQIRNFVRRLSTPARPAPSEPSPELHREQELKRGMRGD